MIVAWILGIYATIIVLLNLPFMQKFIAKKVANTLSEELNTKVSIGSVNVGFLNRIIVNDLEAEDQKGVMMLKAGRVSASLDFMRTIRGQISIPSAQLFGTTAIIYKDSTNAPLNIQFVIDAFSSKDDKESSPLNLRINTLLVRHTNIKYDIKDKPLTKGKFDINHIDARKTGFNLSLKALTEDSVNVSLKRFSTLEYNSGIYVKSLNFKCEANKEDVLLTDFNINTRNSSLDIPVVALKHTKQKNHNHIVLLEPVNLDGQVCLNDFGCFVPKLNAFTDPYTLHLQVEGTDDKIVINKLDIDDAKKDLDISLDGVVYNIQDNPSVDAEIKHISVSNNGISQIISKLSIDEKSVQPLLNAGDIDLQSSIHYDKSVVSSKGTINTDAGSIAYDALLTEGKQLQCQIDTDPKSSVNLGKIINNENIGSISANINADITFVDKQKLPNGTIKVSVPNFIYNNYEYNNINIDALCKNNKADIQLDIDDANANIKAEIDYAISNNIHNVDLDMSVKGFNPHAMQLVKDYADNSLSLDMKAHLNGSNIDNINGALDINDIVLQIPDSTLHLDNINASLEQHNDGYTNLIVDCDFLDARIKGYGKLSTLVNDFKQVISTNLNTLIKADHVKSNSTFDYDLAFYDSPILHHFIDEDYSVSQPIHIIGSMNAEKDIINLDVNAPLVTYGKDTYKNVNIVCCNNSNQLSLKASGLTHNEDQAIKIDLNAIAVNNVIDSNVKLKMKNRNDIDVNLSSRVSLEDSLGKLKTLVDLRPSEFVINDTTWNVTPANISVYGKDIACHNLKIFSGDKYVTVEGRASDNPSDSLIAKLKNVEIEYVLNVVNFTAVDFSGIATGEATLCNLLDKPYFNANLNVKNFCLEGGLLGNANINGHWDDSVNGIAIEAQMVDMYKHRDRLTSNMKDKMGITRVNGFVSPANNDINLHVDVQDTHASVLQGFLDMVFNDIDGYLRGYVDVVGPLSKVDLEGKVTGLMSMTLKATNVPYMFEGDTIRLERGLIDFKDVKMHDYQDNIGLLNGKVTHSNLRNFAYTFDADVRSMLVYDEKEYNANKFMATVFASGNVHLDGSDGHPINISGNITTNRGSVFAYDNVSPDALVSSSFIEFRDVTKINEIKSSFIIPENDDEKKYDNDDLSQYIIKKEKQKSNYEGDIFMDFHCNINPNCEVKLRMDRQDDAYISVYGNSIIQAKWHNKGAFQMFGTYNVNNGSYRLYMHDLVYRDLSIQQGSAISFDGNPFDADIHLICNHEIHNVPLSDLTSTNAYSQNNKVKVVCVLDITGTVSNMDFKFDINLPNVNDETRQLVKSMINSEEEMNTQMIYLLAVNRFYPNDFARANGDDKSGQAVNSFVSSTLSGQINQMLSSIIGTNSNWNFGTGISTGEKGWQDMDVEGILTGRLFNDRLLLNGNFGYRDNALTNTQSFIGDFELKWRLWENGNTYLKAYNMTNDRYFTKGTLNTQGLGVSLQYDFESFKSLFRKNKNVIELKTSNEK